MTATAETLAVNLRLLMDVFEWKPADLAEKTGGEVSDRMISYVLNCQRVPSIEVAEIMARPFGLTGWQLLIPSLPQDIERSKSMRKVIDAYIAANNEGKDMIEMIAQREIQRKIGNHDD